MKLLASALSLVLVGLTGIWLWFDATAEARQDLPGVVVSADQDPGAPAVRQPGADDVSVAPTEAPGQGDTAGTAGPASPMDPAEAAAATEDPGDPAGRTDQDRATLDSRMVALTSVLDTLRASRGELSDLAAAAAERAAEEEAADAEGDGSSGGSGSGSSSGSAPPAPAPQPAPVPLPPPSPVPQPVQPAPVTPPGMCWDDDEWEECDDDDWDDDWDDDDWDD